jgi:serine/threonine protein kinase
VSTIRGQQLIGKELGSCILEKLLGYGGSSAVFLAQQQTPQRKVAVKVFLPRTTTDIKMQRNYYNRFLHEAEAASELDYPTILPIYAYGEQDGMPYIVMPYMPGGTLADYIEKHGPLSLDEAQLYLEQLASALDYAHAHGCVHCDVKPANILLDGEGHVMLSDFGIARVTQPGSTNGHELKHAPETLMGTPDYISPEQALGQSLDGRSDVYSLGITLFFLLSGSPPFKADSPIAMALLHVHEPAPLLSMFRDDISPAIDLVVSKALAKWPDDRFQTAGDFSAAFARAISDPESIDIAYEHIKTSRGIRNTPRLVPASSAPLARVDIKPVRERSFSLSHTLFMIVLVLAVLGSTITAGLIIWLANTHPVPQSSATPTATKAIQDILADDKYGWPNISNISGQFFFTNGQYHILNNSPSDGALALYETYQYADFNLTVTTSEVRDPINGNGIGYYGIIFRSAIDESHYYLFEVTTADGGQYVFWRADKDPTSGKPVYDQPPLASGTAHLRQSNVITIDAKGNSFSFFINGKQVGNGKPVIDPSKPAFTSGAVGLFVENQGAEVAFSKMHIVTP